MSVKNKLLAWGAVLSWAGFTAYYISTAKMKLSVKDLLLMMPQCCEMTDLTGSGYAVFPPETMIKFCFAFVLLHFVTWWMTADEVLDETNVELSKIKKIVKNELLKDEEIEEDLMNSSVSIVENIDLEFEHCAAIIGANNETPGQRVGGEIEWATGETSSEEEDATREIIGAHINKANTIEDEKILRCLTYPDENFDVSITKGLAKEPNVMSNFSDDACARSEGL